VVADAARARIFRLSAANKPLEEIADLANPEARLKDADLDRDRPGQTFSSQGRGGGHPMRPGRTAEEKSTELFARDIASSLREALIAGEFERLVVAAPPGFLGDLRKHLDEQVLQIVVESLSLDLTRETPGAIKKRLTLPSAL
jgi:protein required for attachment to host cells